MESSGILGSQKTPVKKVTSKTRAASKDLVCLLCGMSFVGERCTFNVENHGLLDKMQSILRNKCLVVCVDHVAAKRKHWIKGSVLSGYR